MQSLRFRYLRVVGWEYKMAFVINILMIRKPNKSDSEVSGICSDDSRSYEAVWKKDRKFTLVISSAYILHPKLVHSSFLRVINQQSGKSWDSPIFSAKLRSKWAVQVNSRNLIMEVLSQLPKKMESNSINQLLQMRPVAGKQLDLVEGSDQIIVVRASKPPYSQICQVNYQFSLAIPVQNNANPQKNIPMLKETESERIPGNQWSENESNLGEKSLTNIFDQDMSGIPDKESVCSDQGRQEMQKIHELTIPHQSNSNDEEKQIYSRYMDYTDSKLSEYSQISHMQDNKGGKTVRKSNKNSVIDEQPSTEQQQNELTTQEKWYRSKFAAKTSIKNERFKNPMLKDLTHHIQPSVEEKILTTKYNYQCSPEQDINNPDNQLTSIRSLVQLRTDRRMREIEFSIMKEENIQKIMKVCCENRQPSIEWNTNVQLPLSGAIVVEAVEEGEKKLTACVGREQQRKGICPLFDEQGNIYGNIYFRCKLLTVGTAVQTQDMLDAQSQEESVDENKEQSSPVKKAENKTNQAGMLKQPEQPHPNQDQKNDHGHSAVNISRELPGRSSNAMAQPQQLHPQSSSKPNSKQILTQRKFNHKNIRREREQDALPRSKTEQAWTKDAENDVSAGREPQSNALTDRITPNLETEQEKYPSDPITRNSPQIPSNTSRSPHARPSQLISKNDQEGNEGVTRVRATSLPKRTRQQKNSSYHKRKFTEVDYEEEEEKNKHEEQEVIDYQPETFNISDHIRKVKAQRPTKNQISSQEDKEESFIDEGEGDYNTGLTASQRFFKLQSLSVPRYQSTQTPQNIDSRSTQNPQPYGGYKANKKHLQTIDVNYPSVSYNDGMLEYNAQPYGQDRINIKISSLEVKLVRPEFLSRYIKMSIPHKTPYITESDKHSKFHLWRGQGYFFENTPKSASLLIQLLTDEPNRLNYCSGGLEQISPELGFCRIKISSLSIKREKDRISAYSCALLNISNREKIGDLTINYEIVEKRGYSLITLDGQRTRGDTRASPQQRQLHVFSNNEQGDSITISPPKKKKKRTKKGINSHRYETELSNGRSFRSQSTHHANQSSHASRLGKMDLKILDRLITPNSQMMKKPPIRPKRYLGPNVLIGKADRFKNLTEMPLKDSPGPGSYETGSEFDRHASPF